MKYTFLFLISSFVLVFMLPSFAQAEEVMHDTMMTKDYMMSEGYLENVTAGKEIRGVVTPDSATGHAYATTEDGKFVVHAAFSGLGTPNGDHFYEGWIVQRQPFAFISTGKLSLKDGKYVNHFVSDTDYSSYDFYVLTLEPNDGDDAPADHIFEGELPQKMMEKDMMMHDSMMNRDEVMMKKQAMMSQKQKMHEARKSIVRAKIESNISHLSEPQITAILERITAYRTKIQTEQMSDSKRMRYNELLDIIEEILLENKMMSKESMMQK